MLDSIRFLRGVAALLVVVYHACEYARRHGYPELAEGFNVGAFGVDIFFVISGYVMLLAIDKAHVPQGWKAATDFIAKRVIRIGPTYWLGTSILYGVYVAMPTKFQAFSATVEQYVRSLCFLPIDNGHTTISPILSQGWTLYHEFYFYAVLGFLIWAGARRALLFLAPALVALICLLLNAALDDTHRPWVELAASPINVEFAFGCVIYLLKQTPALRRLQAPLFLVAAALVLLLVIAPDSLRTKDWTRVLYWGLPAAGIFYVATALEPVFKRFGRHFSLYVGDPSYSIYIFHGLSFSAIDIVLQRLLPNLGAWPFLAVLTVLAVAACNVMYRGFEAPVTHWLSGAWKKRSLVVSPQ